MADSASEVRQRKAPAIPAEESAQAPASPKKTRKQTKADEDENDVWLDVLRVLCFLFVASCGLSYLISGGETWFWGMSNPPKYLQTRWWKTQFMGETTTYMTLAELAQFDGKDESKPIYISINGTIYDVSAGRRIYGPGGSYSHFAGCDASRGFVTGCFAEDRTLDMRGVEDMFMPLDDPEADAPYGGPEELRQQKRKERAAAKKKVHDALKHWVDFFAKSEKYQYVGKLKLEPGWEGPKKKLCKQAQEQRTKRKAPGE